MLKIGEAISNWKDNSEEYQKIQGILIDVKSFPWKNSPSQNIAILYFVNAISGLPGNFL